MAHQRKPEPPKRTPWEKNTPEVKAVPSQESKQDFFPLVDVVSPFNQIPKAINLVRYRFWPDKNPRVAYEPIHMQVQVTQRCGQTCTMCYGHAEHLHPNFSERSRSKDMDLKTFTYLLEQMPTLESLVFSGWGEPFLNPDLFKMVRAVHRYNGASTEVVTNGLHLADRQDEILASPLRVLVISINGHKPSMYSAMTGMNAQNFITVRDNVKALIRKRNQRRRGKQPHPLRVELSMVLDTTHYREIHDMIAFAQELGVDGIRFENYTSPDHQKSHRTLYRQDTEVLNVMMNLNPANYRIRVTLPTLLDKEMSNHRYCRDPFTTVTVDGSCNISACSRQQLFMGRMGKVWDGDFWNNDRFQWLREVHGNGEFEVPLACQNCPNNVHLPGRVLNDYPHRI